MKRSRSRKAAQFAGIFALGAAIGSVCALLYAPLSGRETRRRIRQRFNTVKRETERRVARAERRIRREAVQLRDTATERLGDARAWVENHLPNGYAKRSRRRHLAHHA